MKIKFLLSLVLLLVFTTSHADRDLTYPPPGTAAPVINSTNGQENTVTPLTPEEAENRRKQSSRQHIIITPRFSTEQIGRQNKKTPIKNPLPKQKSFNDYSLKNHRQYKPTNFSPNSSPTAEGLLWKIERGSMRPSFLFGTMHIDDPRVTNLPSTVLTAFDQSDIFSPEITMELSDLASMSMELFNQGGYSLEVTIGPTLFNEIVTILEPRGIPPLLAKSMKPWAVALVLSMPATRTGEVLDQKLYLQAKQQGKRIQALETLQEQISVFNNMTEQDQLTLLNGAVANYEKMPDMIEQLIQAYLSRNLSQLQSLSKSLGPDDPDMVEKLDTVLVVNRNVKMAERLIPILKQGNAFIAVGALHLPGAKGIIRLLENQGYKLTAVY